MNVFANWDLVILAITIAGIGFIGTAVFFSDRKSISNQSFLLFAVVTMIWSTSNYLYTKEVFPAYALWLVRSIIFLGVWHAFTFFQLCYVFPSHTVRFKKWYRYALLPTTIAIAILASTPLTLKPTASINGTEIGNGPGIVVFSLFVGTLILSGISILIKKSIQFKGIERRQTAIVTLGTLLTFLLILVFNVVFPAVLNVPSFIPFSALFIFPFLIFTAYSILRLHLFDVKAIAMGSLMFLLAIANILGAVFADSTPKVLFNVSEFILTLSFGFYLIRGVIKEVKQREEIERLAKKLEKANKRLKELDKSKSEFVSIASHQLRSPLTAMRGYASMLLEGSYGKLPKKAAEAVERIGESSRLMAVSVEDYLNVSRIESGNMKYELSDFNLKEEVEHIIDDKRQEAIKKGLLLRFKSDVDTTCIVHADIGKTTQIVHNLVNNALKYTPKGTVSVFVHDDKKKKEIHVDIIDSGIGMSEEDLENLFGKFHRAKDANKTNVTGTGLGLFVARSMAQQMKGGITAFSDGPGKGSTFRLTMKLEM